MKTYAQRKIAVDALQEIRFALKAPPEIRDIAFRALEKIELLDRESAKVKAEQRARLVNRKS